MPRGILSAVLLLLLYASASASASEPSSLNSFEVRTAADIQQFLEWFWGHVAAAHRKASVDAIVDVRLIADEPGADAAAGAPRRRETVSQFAWSPHGDEVGV